MSEREGSRVSVVTWGANPGPLTPVRGCGPGSDPSRNHVLEIARLRLIADDPGGLLAATEDHAMR